MIEITHARNTAVFNISVRFEWMDQVEKNKVGISLALSMNVHTHIIFKM